MHYFLSLDVNSHYSMCLAPSSLSTPSSAEMPEYGDILRIPEVRKASTKVDEDRNYAVFVSYVEFYNNAIYDLLDDSPHDTKSRWETLVCLCLHTHTHTHTHKHVYTPMCVLYVYTIIL